MKAPRLAWIAVCLLALLAWIDSSNAQAPDTSHVSSPGAAPADTTRAAPAPATPTPSGVPAEEKQAAAKKPGEEMRAYIGILFGPQGYGMNDVNDWIAEQNAQYQGSGFSLGDIKGGFGYGGGVRVWPSQKLYFALDYMRLPASTEEEATINHQPVSTKLELPANSVLLTAAYFRKWHGLHYGLGGGGGYYICRGQLTRRVGDVHESHDVKGQGPGFHVLAMGVFGPPKVNFEMAFGYRFAKTGFLEADGVPITNAAGYGIKADWNGLMTQLGISIRFDPGGYPEGH